MKSKIIAILFLTLCIPALFNSCCKEEYCPKKYAGVYSCKVSKYQRHTFNPTDTIWENKTRTATIKYIDDSTYSVSVKLENEAILQQCELKTFRISENSDSVFIINKNNDCYYFNYAYFYKNKFIMEVREGTPVSGIFYWLNGTKVL